MYKDLTTKNTKEDTCILQGYPFSVYTNRENEGYKKAKEHMKKNLFETRIK